MERHGGAQRHLVGVCRALRFARGPRTSRRQGCSTRTSDSRHCYRKCVRDSSDPIREAPSERSEPVDPIAGGSRSAGSMPGHAVGSCVRGRAALDAGARALRHVDLRRCAVLYCLHTTSCCYCTRQVLGCDKHRLYPRKNCTPCRPYDCLRVGCKLSGVYSTATGMERSRLGPKSLRRPTLRRESRRRLSNFCDGIVVLRASSRNTNIILANIPNRQKKNTSAERGDSKRWTATGAGGRRTGRCGRQRWHCSCCSGGHWATTAHYIRNDNNGLHKRVIEQYESRKTILRERPRSRSSNNGLRRCSRRLLPHASATKTQRSRRFQKREKSGKDIGNNYGRLRSMLASLLRVSDPSADVRLRSESSFDVIFSMAGLLQLDAEPGDLHSVQSGVQTCVSAVAVRAACASPARSAVASPSFAPTRLTSSSSKHTYVTLLHFQRYIYTPLFFVRDECEYENLSSK